MAQLRRLLLLIQLAYASSAAQAMGGSPCETKTLSSSIDPATTTADTVTMVVTTSVVMTSTITTPSITTVTTMATTTLMLPCNCSIPVNPTDITLTVESTASASTITLGNSIVKLTAIPKPPSPCNPTSALLGEILGTYFGFGVCLALLLGFFLCWPGKRNGLRRLSSMLACLCAIIGLVLGTVVSTDTDACISGLKTGIAASVFTGIGIIFSAWGGW